MCIKMSKSLSNSSLTLKFILAFNVILFMIFLTILILAVVFIPKGVSFIDEKIKEVVNSMDETKEHMDEKEMN